MKTIEVFSALCAVASMLVTSACEYSPEMTERSMAYNEAVANSNNQLLLRNIVRASERRPVYYSGLESDAAAETAQPSLNIGIPFTRARSFQRNVNMTAPGTQSISALAAITSAIGITGIESNTMTLQTFDDKNSQAGMLQALTFKQLKSFFDEGFNRDLLMLMFISRISVRTALLPQIDAAVAEQCGAADPNAVCQYILSDPYAAGRPGGWKEHWSLQSCAGAAHSGPDKTMEFNNDPALEIAASPHSQMCFEMLLQDMLALGLDITPGDTLSSEVVDTDVPANVARDPSFRIETLKENIRVINKPGSTSAVLCRSKPDSVAFTVSLDNDAGAASREIAETLSADLAKARSPSHNINRLLGICAEPDLPSLSSDSAATDRRTVRSPANRDPDDGDKPIRLIKKDFTVYERSFAGMIYYLGEIVRAEESGVDPRSIVRIRGRNPAFNGPGYTEALFYASPDLPADDAVLSANDDAGHRVNLAKSCPSSIQLASRRSGGCSEEYPDTESIAVIALLNQIWGYQKEAAAPPAAPVVLANPQ